MAKKNDKIIPMFLGETVQEYLSIISERVKIFQMVGEWVRWLETQQTSNKRSLSPG